MNSTDMHNYQKASVRRADPNNAWIKLSQAPRRSYLGKYRRITPEQNRWVRSLLNHWGSAYGGSGTAHLSGGGGLWAMALSGWTVEQQERITDVLAGLRKIGYSGDELMKKARVMICPKKSLSILIGNAGDEEEAEFMEAIILKSFRQGNPVYEIGRDYYTWRKTINDMARWMQFHYAPSLTEKQCIDRVRWCIELFNSAVFVTLKSEIGFENAENNKNNLKISFESA